MRGNESMSGRQVKLKRAENSSILYHYTKSNGINGIINHNCFWATKSDFLNDPNEFSYIRGIIEEVCRDTIKSPALKEMFLADSIYSKHENAGTASPCGRNSAARPVII